MTLTVTRHQEDIKCKTTSSLSLAKMIAKLESTQSNARPNTEPPTANGRYSNKSTTTEPPP